MPQTKRPSRTNGDSAAQFHEVGSRPPNRLPLCFDLDGSLLKTDTLVEALVAGMRNWRIAIRLPGLFASGKAGLKDGLARLVNVDPAPLPYNEAALEYLRAEKTAGRLLVLATAANHRIAESVNRHLGGLFDEIVASDAQNNLKGAAKAEALVARFGEAGFTYAGNDHSDLAVWQRAGGAVLVGTSASVARRTAQLAPIEKTFAGSGGFLVPLLRELRLYQWSKNLLVFVPIFASGGILDPTAWLSALLTFFAFGLVASSLYAVNDIYDLDADRRHARKRARPFASGALSLKAGIIAIPLLFCGGLALGISAGVLPYLAAYAVVSFAYSMRLKEVRLLDVFILTALYTIRLFAGGEATGHEISLWLLAFSGFFFFGLAIMKRVAELKSIELGEVQDGGRRSYGTGDIAILQAFSVAAAFVACLILALYVQSEQVALVYRRPALLWWMVPLMLFWQCRLLLATAGGNMDDDPIVYAAKDKVTPYIVAGLALCVLLAR